jgi:hypothetical protein
MVSVLLDAGAEMDDIENHYSAMQHAIEKRRIDLVELMVAHGADPKTVDMRAVFDCYDPTIMKYFVEHGADLRTGLPIAGALSRRIQPALGVCRACIERNPDLKEQLNIALRSNCKVGNLKWVSLLLWAGADPFRPGMNECDEEPDTDYEGLTAVECAAWNGKFEVFDLPYFRRKLGHPAMLKAVESAHGESAPSFVERVLEAGLDLNDQANGGSSLVSSRLNHFQHDFRYYLKDDNLKEYLDYSRVAADQAILESLLRHGALWRPVDRQEINDIRRGFRKLPLDVRLKAVASLCQYQACYRESFDALNSGAAFAQVALQPKRIASLIENLPSGPAWG